MGPPASCDPQHKHRGATQRSSTNGPEPGGEGPGPEAGHGQIPFSVAPDRSPGSLRRRLPRQPANPWPARTRGCDRGARLGHGHLRSASVHRFAQPGHGAATGPGVPGCGIWLPGAASRLGSSGLAPGRAPRSRRRLTGLLPFTPRLLLQGVVGQGGKRLPAALSEATGPLLAVLPALGMPPGFPGPAQSAV